MEKQIKIQFKGKYQIDEFTKVTDPLVICTSANDNMVNSVAVAVKFENEKYSYGRNIGSFDYEETWDNDTVITHINNYMSNAATN